MEAEIKAFNDAVEALNFQVQASMDELKMARDLDGLEALADSLPQGYRGRRRVYQAFLELTDV